MGLIGSYNGNNSDDFVQPDGKILSENSSEKDLFTYGQLWRTTAQESIFFYDDKKSESHATVNINIDSFRPVFFDEVFEKMNETEKKALEKLCGDNYLCKVDYTITKNPDLANNTKNYSDKQDQDENRVANSPPIFDEDILTTLKVEVGNSYQFYLNASDPENQNVTFKAINPLPTDSSLDKITGIFRWTVSSDVYDSYLNFVAVDEKGLESSELQINVQLCNCSGNNGVCEWDQPRDSFNETDYFFIVDCACKIYYDGENCEEDRDSCQDSPCLQLQVKNPIITQSQNF